MKTVALDGKEVEEETWVRNWEDCEVQNWWGEKFTQDLGR